MDRNSVLIVEDHGAVREGLHAILKKSGQFLVVGEADCCAKAETMIQRHSPQLCLVDISLGKESGLDLLPRLYDLRSDCRLVVHSMFARLDYLQRALNVTSTAGYITKQSSPDVLVEGLRLIARGEFFFDKYINDLMIPALKNNPANFIEIDNSDYNSLGHREQQVFRLLVEGYTSREIASRLFISYRTVENYKSTILKKLKLTNDAELVRYAQKIGILD